ncbi:MAG TPA: hypothetical protein V6C86_12795 [Oculatellaceae cyanobacterium]
MKRKNNLVFLQAALILLCLTITPAVAQDNGQNPTSTTTSQTTTSEVQNPDGSGNEVPLRKDAGPGTGMRKHM